MLDKIAGLQSNRTKIQGHRSSRDPYYSKTQELKYVWAISKLPNFVCEILRKFWVLQLKRSKVKFKVVYPLVLRMVGVILTFL